MSGALRLYIGVPPLQGESAQVYLCWSLWAEHFATVQFASLSGPQWGQIYPLEGEQKVMLGHPGPCSPHSSCRHTQAHADMHVRTHTHPAHTLTSITCSQIKYTKVNQDITHMST